MHVWPTHAWPTHARKAGTEVGAVLRVRTYYPWDHQPNTRQLSMTEWHDLYTFNLVPQYDYVRM